MRFTSVLLFCQLTAVASAQIMVGSASSNGGGFSYETRLEPPAPKITSIGGGTFTENQIIKRYICDFSGKTYFGYDLTIDSLEDGRYRYTLSPLSLRPEEIEEVFDSVQGWKPLPLPRQPATTVLAAGETLALDLFVNPATGQKIVEYIEVEGGRGRRLSASGEARDFSIEDAALHIASPRLSINGKLLESTANYGGGVSGSPVWVYVRGRGRFVFSLAPHWDLGFQKAGEIRGSTMWWRYGGDEFSMNTNRRIAPGGGAYHLYVFNDPSFRPRKRYDNSEFVTGAGGSLESLAGIRPDQKRK